MAPKHPRNLHRSGSKLPPGTDDPVLRNAQDTDIVIPIMGATGAGKSTFLNHLLGPSRRDEHALVSASLTSCTVHLHPVVLPLPEKYKNNGRGRIVVVDTPGFDDTYSSDVEILKRIADWLSKSYSQSMILGGVIYLYDLSLDRFTGSARRNLTMFNELCGQDALSKVILVTSKWEKFSSRTEAEDREMELRDLIWAPMLQRGASSCSFEPAGEQAAWEVVYKVLEKGIGTGVTQVGGVLQIQRELNDYHRALPQTRAAHELVHTIEEALEIRKQQLEALGAGNRGSGTNNTDIATFQNALKQLQTPMTTKVKQFLGLYRN